MCVAALCISAGYRAGPAAPRLDARLWTCMCFCGGANEVPRTSTASETSLAHSKEERPGLPGHDVA